MKIYIKRSSYYKWTKSKKKKYKMYLLKTEKDKTCLFFYQNIFHVEHGGSAVFLWFFGNVCNSAPFLRKAVYASQTG